MIDLKKIQREHKDWEMRNFGEQSADRALIGITEELGELAHAHLKLQQGIRTNEYHILNMQDALGDIFVYALSYCNKMGFDLEEIIETTWKLVKKRDWANNKIDGTK